MNIKKMDFETKFVESKEAVTPQVAQAYFRYLGYTVYPHYVSLIKNSRNLFNMDADTISIFHKYDTGFPDFLLEKDGKMEIVKYRYNNTVSFEQLNILKELSSHIKVTLIFFVKEESITSMNFQKLLEVTTDKRKRKGFKPLWVAAEMYKVLGTELYDKENMTALSKKLGIKEDKIRFFLTKTISPVTKLANVLKC